jgi:hypothetical protein
VGTSFGSASVRSRLVVAFQARTEVYMAKKLVFGSVLLVWVAISLPAAVFVNSGADWKYFKGLTEASSPTTAWRQPGFNDANFTPACAPFWYGDILPGGTELTDMMNRYTTIYMRRTFRVNDLTELSGLRLRFRCDDGFIAWINGTEVHRYNVPAGERAFNTSATGAVTEPPPWTEVDISVATNYIVAGTNLIAVHAFNAGSGSTDLGIDIALTSSAPDSVPPTVASKAPAPSVLNSLSQINVTFSEPVQGINASDLRINGTPAAGVSCGNESYTFTFPQPPYGIVSISWAGAHGITDFGNPPNAFNASGPGATWAYSLVDNIAPILSYQLPFAGVTIRSLTQIQTVFSEPVTGINASDLLINGNPAANVSTLSASNYIFTFPEPLPGDVHVQFAADHGIRDLASSPNNFAGGSWTYTLDPNAVISAVRINEIVAANVTGLRDEDNEPQDWVELFNTSSNTVSLAGWSLTDDDDEPDKWVFPPISIAARGYLVVFCSGKDRRIIGGSARLHTNFRLDPEGEYLALYNAEVPPQPVSVYAPYPHQRRDYSYGYDPVDQLKYFQAPTPGAANPASSITGIVADTKFSHDRGFYDAPFSLSITCATPGVTIRYTLDGIAPSNNVGTIYSAPIAISRTTVVRAAAFKTGLLSSDVDCHTYLFLDDVITQSANGAPPPGWPSTWGANRVDYGMDPEVVGPNSGTIKDDLKAIPTVSIVMHLDDMFGASRGIYSNPGGDTITWERACSLELIRPDDIEGFQINCGIRIRGGFSRSTDNAKHAFRFFFRQEYGPSKLVYPMFGSTGAREFDKFDMRTMQNYSWSFGGDPNMICLRDVMSRDAQLAMGQASTRGNFFHLYINGQYWGLYNSEERPEAAFAESYVGGAAENYDVVKVLDGYNTGVTDGNMAAWTRLWQAATNGFASDEDYYKVQGLNVDGTPNPTYENLLDVDNLIDYMFIILYGGNLDAPISNFLGNESPNNWYGFRDRSGTNGGFRFVTHDAEHTMLDVNSDRTGPYNAGDPTKPSQAGIALQKSQPQYIWTRLQANAEFRMRVADRLQKHCFNAGPLSVQGMRSMYLARSNEIQRAIVGESARWGDARVASPLGRSHWISAVMGVYNNFITNNVVGSRTTVFLNQMRTDNMWPTVTAPVFNSPGGVVSNGFRLFMTNSNPSSTIYYTLNGIDPRLRGGGVASGALAYTPGTPIIINFPTLVRARVRAGTTWSPITEASFYTPQDLGKLIVTEIMYNPVPANADDFEFLEFKNVGTNILDFTGMGFDAGITFAFPTGTRLGPGQFFVMGRNRGSLQARYPGLAVHGVYSGRLDNGGERLAMTNILGARIFSVEYKDSGRWPLTPDGRGFSLVSRNANANANPNNPSSWRASTELSGSPGRDDPAPTIPGIVITEALTHTDLPQVDAIELYNPTASAVNIGGWFLTDDAAAPTKFRIPNDTLIDPGAYLVFDESHFNPTSDSEFGFALDSRGDQVYLFSGDANTNLTGYSYGFNFDAAPNGVSFGRHILSTGDEHFVLQTSSTLAGPNAGPLIGPVVIRQIMYHPPDLPGEIDNSADEYVEIQNRTLSAVPLYDPLAPTNTWHVRGGIDFDFPEGVTLNATQSLVLVNFDPNDTVARNAFVGKYGSFSSVRLFGPYNGKLDNSSDTVRLERPDQPDTNGVPYIHVDQVDYRDAAPWPSGPDGSGSALQRIDLAAYGDDPANWVGAAPLTIGSIEPLHTQVRTGTNAVVTIAVSAFGTGELKYQWYRDSVVLQDETNASITIVDVQFEDDGLYTVRVTDLTGSAMSSPAALRVLVTPTFIQPPIGQTVVAGGTVTLSATYFGNPPPFTNEWRRGAIPLYTNITWGYTDFFTFTAQTNPGTVLYRLVIRSASTPTTNGVSHQPAASVVVLADSDRDGIPDTWESAYELDPNLATDAEDDPDRDTMSNREEYIAGTNPKDDTSYLQVEEVLPGNSATISFQAVSNRTYTVEYCDDLSSTAWTKLGDVIATATNRTATLIDPAPSATRFYRIATPRQP